MIRAHVFKAGGRGLHNLATTRFPIELTGEKSTRFTTEARGNCVNTK